MHVSSFFSFQWLFLRLRVGVLISIVLLLGIGGTEITHAADGWAHFDIRPTFFPSAHTTALRANFIYNNHSGDLLQDSIHVTNNGTARGTVNIHPEDASTSQMSGETFSTNTDPRSDVGGWITLSRQQVTLNPGKSQDVPFILRIPAHVRPGQHAGGIVAEEPDRQQSSSQGSFQTFVRLHTREIIGVLINLAGPTLEKLDATGVSYDQSNNYQAVLVGLANTGTQFLHCAGSLRVTNEAGLQLQNVPLKLKAILPQTAIDYPVYMHRTALKPGTYTAILSLQYEHNHTLNYTTSFVVPQPQLLKNFFIPRTISDLVTANADFFSTLTPWHYVVGACLLFLLLSAVFFWSQRLYKSSINLKKKIKSRKPNLRNS